MPDRPGSASPNGSGWFRFACCLHGQVPTLFAPDSAPDTAETALIMILTSIHRQCQTPRNSLENAVTNGGEVRCHREYAIRFYTRNNNVPGVWIEWRQRPRGKFVTSSTCSSSCRTASALTYKVSYNTLSQKQTIAVSGSRHSGTHLLVLTT